MENNNLLTTSVFYCTHLQEKKSSGEKKRNEKRALDTQGI